MKAFDTVVFAAVLLLAACAAPDVDRTASGFDHTTYHSDLNACQGDTAVDATVDTLIIGFLGGALGAGLLFQSGNIYAFAGGAVVGGALGTVYGSVKSVVQYNDKVDDCLRTKGYAIP